MATRQTKSIGGLLLVFIALLIELFTTFCENFSSVNAIFGGVVGWIGVGAIVLAIIGLTQLAGVNRDFAKSRLFWIIDICVSVAIVIITMAGGAAGNYILVGVIGVIGSVVRFIIDLLKVKTLMYGCADVAEANKDKIYAHKCVNAWKNYLLSKIILTAAAVIMFIIVAVTGASGLASGNVEAAAKGIAAGVVIMLIISLAAAVYAIIALIMVISKTIGTYSHFKDGNISSFNASTKDLLNDMKDDHKDLFGDAKDSFANVKDNFKDGISDVKDDIGDLTGRDNTPDDIIDSVEDTADNAAADAKKEGSGLGGKLGGLGGKLKDGAAKVGGTVKDGAAKAGSTVADGAAKVGGTVKDGAAKAGSTVADGAAKVGGTVKDGAVKAGETVKNGAVKTGETIKNGVTKEDDTFADSADDIIDDYKSDE